MSRPLWLKFCIIIIITSTNLLPIGSANPSLHNHNNGNNNNNNHALVVSGWQRSVESQLSRVVGQLDQLEARVTRIQSLMLLRFDNIETGQTTSKLRMEVWGDELNRMNRLLESKFDIILANIDSKLESKLTAMQRDNRRYQEFLSNAFNSVALGQEKVKEKVILTMNEVNSSLEVWKSTAKNFTAKGDTSTSLLVQNSDKMLNILQDFVANSSLSSHSSLSSSSGCGHQDKMSQQKTTNATTLLPTSSLNIDFAELQNQTTTQYQLLGNKVTNMFEDLMRRSSSMEGLLKDAVSIANVTKRDVHDGFRTVLALSPSSTSQNYNNNQQRSYNSRSNSYGNNNNGGGGGATSSELMSAVIVEALASVDSMSTALGRKITEFSRSMDERLEMVSMSINGFLESCVRIQDNQPLIEEHIADLLIKILNTVDNSTRSASELWLGVANQILDERDNFTRTYYSGCTDINAEDEIAPFLPPDSGGGGDGSAVNRGHQNGATQTTNNRNHHHQHRTSSNSFEALLLQTGNEVVNNKISSPLSSSRPRSSHQLPTTHSRYDDDEIFDTEDTETLDSGEEETTTTTTFPEESTDTTRHNQHHRHNNHQQRRPAARPTTNSNRRRSGNRADGESLTEADKMSLWESLVVLSPSPPPSTTTTTSPTSST